MDQHDTDPTPDEELFEEVDLFDTALIQGGCTNDVQPADEDETK